MPTIIRARTALGMPFRVSLSISLALAIISTLVAPLAALAQNDGQLRAKTYELIIRPEFDTPDVLVVNQATLINTSASPYQGPIRFRVPRGAQLSMVCEIAAGGGHACQPFRSEDKGEYVEVWWNASRPLASGEEFPVFIEYYYDPFTSRSPRQFQYLFLPVYPMDDLSVTVTQPKGATDFRLVPAPGSSEKAANEMIDWRYAMTNLGTSPMTFSVSYARTSNTPSVPREEAPAGQSGPAGANRRPGIPPAVILAGALVAVVLGVAVHAVSPGSRKEKR